MPKLSEAEQRALLTESGIVMRIGVIDERGAPYVTPIWFWSEDGFIYFTPRQKSAWFESLKRDPRVSLCIDEQALPYRKVLVNGIAELQFDVGNDALWRPTYQKMAAKYVGAVGAEKYVSDTIDQPRALFRVEMAKAVVSSWRMPVADESGMGIWAKRYFVPGSDF